MSNIGIMSQCDTTFNIKINWVASTLPVLCILFYCACADIIMSCYGRGDSTFENNNLAAVLNLPVLKNPQYAGIKKLL